MSIARAARSLFLDRAGASCAVAMAFRSLSWRIGLPFVAFVLAGSVVLVLLIERQVAADHRARLRRLAETNAAFLERTNLPRSDNLLQSLQQVLGLQTSFRTNGRLLAAPGAELAPGLADVPADGRVHQVGGHDAVAVTLDSRTDLVLARPVIDTWREIWRAPTFTVLGAFWLLAAVVGWIVGRGFVGPLRNLAVRLPEIESAEPVDLPEAERADEIGDVARAFLRTRAALQHEREASERAEKLAVLGRMTAALAHEIQNPVAAIKMHAQLSRGTGETEAAGLIVREAERIDDLVSQWLFLSRPEPPATSVVDVAALLAQVVAARGPQLEHAGVRVELRASGAPPARGDAKRLSQVFSNVVVNAMQAMPRGGLLTVTAERDGEDRLSVRIADGGRGFSGDALARFSEFFFSEKEGGMGIGLSVANEIVRAHGGEISVANRDVGGACVTISLPCAQE